MGPMALRPVMLAAVLLLSLCNAASVAPKSTRAPYTIEGFFTVPSDYVNETADIPRICTEASPSCESVAEQTTGCRVYTPVTGNCTQFCWDVVRPFRSLEQECRRHEEPSWISALGAYQRCLSECEHARNAIRREGNRPHALVRVTSSNGQVSGAHILFTPTRRVLKLHRPALCKTIAGCNEARAERGECSRRMCRPPVLGPSEPREFCWACHWLKTSCSSSCKKCEPWGFCWRRKCTC